MKNQKKIILHSLYGVLLGLAIFHSIDYLQNNDFKQNNTVTDNSYKIKEFLHLND